MAVRTEGGRAIEVELAANKASMVAGLRRIHRDYLASQGLKSDSYTSHPGYGRLLSDTELEELIIKCRKA